MYWGSPWNIFIVYRMPGRPAVVADIMWCPSNMHDPLIFAYERFCRLALWYHKPPPPRSCRHILSPSCLAFTKQSDSNNHVRRTRLTIVASQPDGFEFTIRTPGTPARWRQYHEELSAVWGKLAAAVCENAHPDDHDATPGDEDRDDAVCDIILEVRTRKGANTRKGVASAA